MEEGHGHGSKGSQGYVTESVPTTMEREEWRGDGKEGRGWRRGGVGPIRPRALPSDLFFF